MIASDQASSSPNYANLLSGYSFSLFTPSIRSCHMHNNNPFSYTAAEGQTNNMFQAFLLAYIRTQIGSGVQTLSLEIVEERMQVSSGEGTSLRTSLFWVLLLECALLEYKRSSQNTPHLACNVFAAQGNPLFVGI